MSARDHDRGQRWASILACLGVVGLVGWMTYEQASTPRRPRDGGSFAGDAGPTEGALAASSDGADAGAGAGAGAGTGTATGTGTGDDLSAHGPDDRDADGGPSPLLGLDLGDAATLPSGAPRTVKVGVVLLQWKGAEGATTSTRTKNDALAKAQELARQAKEDFRRAVTQGDPGSAEDIGRIPRGTLDPRTEAVLFNLAPGAVSEAIETPRGYWIVKRID